MAAKTPSPNAAPRPDMKPLTGPKAKLRRMQIRLTGPIGTAAISPIMTPETISMMKFISGLGRKAERRKFAASRQDRGRSDGGDGFSVSTNRKGLPVAFPVKAK